MTVNLSEAIWDDLATLYVAGEASAETRALVEERARADGAFRERLAGARGAEPPPLAPPTLDGELEALRRTREFIRLRGIFLAAGVAFTLLPAAFVWGPQGVSFPIWAHAGLRSSFLAIAAASWVAWWVMRRQLRSAGV